MLTAATLICVALQMLRFWQIGRGIISYPLMVAVYLGYAVVETMLALRDPEQAIVLLFVALNFWAVGMALKGMHRSKHGRVTCPVCSGRGKYNGRVCVTCVGFGWLSKG